MDRGSQPFRYSRIKSLLQVGELFGFPPQADRLPPLKRFCRMLNFRT
jgi:hypothetical protein